MVKLKDYLNTLMGEEIVTEGLEAATEQIIADAQTEIGARYEREPYHNPPHSQFVEMEGAALAATLPPEYQLNRKEHCLLRLAASAHDVWYENPRYDGYDGKNERQSAAWLAAKMREYPEVFDENDITITTLAIMGTWARLHPSRQKDQPWAVETTIQQNVGENGQRPRHIIAQLLCDADLAGLGSPWETQWGTMTGYYLELNPTGGSLETWREYLQLQRLILKNRQYYTPAAQERYRQNLLENLGRVQAILGSQDELERTHQVALERAQHRQKP